MRFQLQGLDRRAFTIPELIIIVGLISLVSIAGIAPYITQQEMLKKQFARSRLQDEISLVISYMFKDVMRAREITVAGAAPQLTLKINTDATNPTERITVTYSLWTDPATNIVYITRTQGADVRKIASNITAFSLSPTGSPIAGNYITVNITGQEEGQTISLQSGMASRAISLP